MKLKQRVYEILLDCNGAIPAIELSKKAISNTAAIGVSIAKLNEEEGVSITKVRFGRTFKYEMLTRVPYDQLFKTPMSERVEAVLNGRRSYISADRILSELNDKSVQRRHVRTALNGIKVRDNRTLLIDDSGRYKMIVEGGKAPRVEVDKSISTAKMNSIFCTVTV